MISVGIDVAKGKSTICAINPYGEILLSPQDYRHNKEDLKSLYQKLQSFKEDIHIVMEATGTYHLPVFGYLIDKGYFVVAENALKIKKYFFCLLNQIGINTENFGNGKSLHWYFFIVGFS